MTDILDTIHKTIRKSVLQEESRKRSLRAKEAWKARKAPAAPLATAIAVIVATVGAGSTQAQERPYQYSAQCLVEIASMTFEQMDFADPEMVEAATAKANRLMDSQQRTINAGAALDAASVNMIALMRVEEAAGRLPPGSADVTAEQHRIHRLLVDNEHLDFRRTAPSCDWPTEPNDDPSARE